MFTASQKSTEMAFYEAIRQNAVERIAQIKTEGQPTQQLQILTEIMNLRQAACNVQLVNKNLHIPSSKLQLFAETVQELLDNRHKALVFSQFVGHLRLIEQQVIKMGISYQYLDGQTPVHTSQTLVDESQKGDGERIKTPTSYLHPKKNTPYKKSVFFFVNKLLIPYHHFSEKLKKCSTKNSYLKGAFVLHKDLIIYTISMVQNKNCLL